MAEVMDLQGMIDLQGVAVHCIVWTKRVTSEFQVLMTAHTQHFLKLSIEFM